MECIVTYGLYHAGTGCLFYLRMMNPEWWDYIVWHGYYLMT